jgi:hypothetical protein
MWSIHPFVLYSRKKEKYRTGHLRPKKTQLTFVSTSLPTLPTFSSMHVFGERRDKVFGCAHFTVLFMNCAHFARTYECAIDISQPPILGAYIWCADSWACHEQRNNATVTSPLSHSFPTLGHHLHGSRQTSTMTTILQFLQSLLSSHKPLNSSSSY